MTLFLPILWLSAGVCLYAGVLFLIAGYFRRQEPMFVAFGAASLLFTIYMVLSTQWYSASTVGAASPVAVFQMTIVCLIYPVFVRFIEAYTGSKHPAVFFVTAACFGFLLIVNLASPSSFLYDELRVAEPLVLPWGERLSSFDVELNPLAWFYYACTYAVFLWAIWRVIHARREQAYWPVWPLVVYLVVQFGVVAHGQLIDVLELRSIYLAEFGFLLLVVLMSITLGREFRRRTVALHRTAASLQEQIEERRDAQERLAHLAYHDYLTGLSNRAAMDERLVQAVDSTGHGTLFAVLLVDLDHFKVINDALGHDVGDELLRRVAERLKASSLENETVVRFGGDEFVVLVEALPPDMETASRRAREIAERILDAMSESYVFDSHELSIGASIGITLFSSEEHDPPAVLRRADMALSRAKTKGRNRIQFFEERMERTVGRRLIVEKGLRSAMEKGRLAAHYQPVVNGEGAVIGAEALLRWNDPKHGLISCEEFIPVAEDTGLIHTLGEFVLNEACAMLAAGGDEILPPHAYVSINVSPWQLASPAYTDRTREIINAHGIPYSRITLEITESAFVHRLEEVSRKIDELSRLGMRFAIDDFGTGYSSLAWLRSLPVQQLKIDHIFIRDLGRDAENPLVETIVAIAKHMDLEVIAEGVEAEYQRTILGELDCDGYQGYLFAPPFSAAELREWIVGRSRAQQ